MTPKRRLTLVFGIAAIAVLAAGIVALSLWPEGSPEPSGLPEPAGEDRADLFKESQDNVNSISFSPPGGKPYTIRRDPESGDCALDAGEAIFPGRQTAMHSAYTCATSLTNLIKVTAEATDGQLALFGLDKPVMTWRVNRADGTSAELTAGAVPAAGTGRYARGKNSREVFLLTDYQSSYLTKTLEEYYDLTFFPYPRSTQEEQTFLLIEYCLLEKDGGVIELRKRSDEEMAEAPTGASLYRITRPAESESSDFMLQTAFFEPVTAIAPESVEALLPADLSAYGLNEPARLTLAGTDGWSGTLLIGRYDAERGGRYVMIEGYDAVLFDPNGDYGFLDVQYADMRARTIWLYDIKTVSSVTFELEGVTRVLTYEHFYEEDTGANTLNGWLDGKEISEINARRLYMAVLRISQEGVTDTPLPSSPPDYRVTIRFLDGGTDTLELYRMSDLQFLIVHNGVNEGLIISRMSLQQNFLSRFDIIDGGGEISSF
ncbi:MAG: DUF4340 domain-containing protein [Oscillospiraceae bacterium]|jgi:hypothetical protein|nr:DUF4340 domain-containing protein [Oscillospiraceae bacterium]